MSFRVAMLLIVMCGGGVLLFQAGAVTAATSQEAVVASGPMAVVALGGGEPEYIGVKKCKKCHSKQFKSWSKTKHAKALDILKPGERADAKTKHNLDPAKDYSTDEACLPCHVVGYGKPGGYVVPDASDAKAVKKMSTRAAVGCEMCHGAGKSYQGIKKEIKKSKRMYKFAELEAVGMTKVEEAVCIQCHNEKSATYDESKKFDFATSKENRDGVHEHFDLKQKEKEG